MTRANDHNTRRFKIELILLAVITLVGLVLRFWALDSVPPGWRDDELINSLVISQKVLDGDLALYYADASGHEALYHMLNAVMLGMFGPGVAGIRWLSAILGTISIPLTYLVAKRLFGSLTGLIAAALLAVSFWSLMYSRVGIRHILTPVLVLAAFYFFLRGSNIWHKFEWDGNSRLLDFALAGMFMGLGFYAYFASRGVPLIFMAFCLYLLLFSRSLIKRYWVGLLVMFGLGMIMAVPLLITLSNQPESEARVSELAVPLVEARLGNFEPLNQHIITTLSMFHGDGDDEWLYNIPHRPVFGPFAALFFWGGVLIALGYALMPMVKTLFKRKTGYDGRSSPASLASAFLLLWWLAGISPGFISVPPASLGHTILAQPAVFILAALPIWWLTGQWFQERKIIPVAIGLILIFSVAVRDWSDYFVEWPQRGMTRFLYRADIHELALFLNANPQISDFGVTGLLAGPWDRVAFSIDLDDARRADLAPRWYNPQRALLLEPSSGFGGFPDSSSPFAGSFRFIDDTVGIGGYKHYEINASNLMVEHEYPEPICFMNGLCLASASFDDQGQRLTLEWVVNAPLDLPIIPLISNPPPPGVYSGPRLSVFAQILDLEGNFLVGDDGFWIDPTTLQTGDRFIQQHWLDSGNIENGRAVVFGMYDPLTGERILTEAGQDHIQLEIGG